MIFTAYIFLNQIPSSYFVVVYIAKDMLCAHIGNTFTASPLFSHISAAAPPILLYSGCDPFPPVSKKKTAKKLHGR